MRSLIFTTALCLSFAAFIAADNSNNNDGCTQTLNHRPNPTSHPYHPGKPHLPSPPRTKTCYVPARGGGLDDSQAIYSAFKACNNGGTVAFLETKYTIAQHLDLTFLNAVDVSIQGEISINPNVQYWVLHAFQYAYQGSSLFWKFGGNDVNIYGGGTINGNGQAWWDILPTNSTIIRPHLIGIIGLHGGSVSNLNLINPPNWFHFVANSSDLIFDRMRMTAISNNTNPPKNSGKSSYMKR
jgi:galacturan 1,4-alpha-galacturonidase